MKFPIIWIPLNTVPNAMEDARFDRSWYLVYFVLVSFVCAAYKPCGYCQWSSISPEVTKKDLQPQGCRYLATGLEKQSSNILSLIDRCL